MSNNDKKSNTKNNEDNQLCSFCQKPKGEVPDNILIAGGDEVKICQRCAKKATKLFEQHQSEFDIDYYKQLTPQKIVDELDQYIIEQAEAKKKVAVAVYNHIKRDKIIQQTGVNTQKSNLVLVGPTGVGKTLMAEALAEILKVPFYIADSTGLTEAGYAGNDVENILWGLFAAAEYNIELAQRGIIYIDEIDKISRTYNTGHSMTRDVSGEGVQQALLSILEGVEMGITQSGRKMPYEDVVNFDTSNVLFILGGMFNGINDIREKRLSVKKPVGFYYENKKSKKDSNKNDNDNEKKTTNISPEDLIEFGFIPEFVGRIGVIAELNLLSKEAMRRILSEPKNSLVEQYTALFEGDNVALTFEEDALQSIVDKSFVKNTGARALRNVMEDVMTEVMYEVPSIEGLKECIVTGDYVDGKGCSVNPVYVINDKKEDKEDSTKKQEAKKKTKDSPKNKTACGTTKTMTK